MKKSILILVLISSFFTVFSQDKVVKIPILKKQEVREVFDLNKNGVLVKVGKPDNILTLKYYTQNLDSVWSTDITKIQYGEFENPIIVSPSGKYIIYVELTGYTRAFGVLQANITFISRDGTKKVLNIQGIKEVGDIKSIFCNDTYLFFYMVFKGEDNVFKSKIMRIKIDDLKKDIFPIHTVKDVFCGYLCHDESNIYISEKKVNTTENKISYVIYKLDLEGKVLQTFPIQPQLTTNYFAPSNNYKYNTGVYSANIYLDVVLNAKSDKIPIEKLAILNKNTDFYDVAYISPSGSRRYETVYINNAYGNIQADIKNGFIYCYGLYSSNRINDYQGFYLNKYDLKGALIASFNSADLPLSNNSEITKRRAEAHNRFVALLYSPNNTLTLDIWENAKVFSFTYDSNLKLVNAYSTATPGMRANMEHVKMCLGPDITLKSKLFLQKERENKVEQTFHLFQYNELNKSSILVRNVEKKKEYNCELLYFKEQ